MRTIGIIVVLLGLALWPIPAMSQTPRACLDWHKDPKGPLPRRDVDNVLYRSLLFRRTGRKYDVETFSDMEKVGLDHCLRWEIVNNSSSPDLVVDELTWQAAGIRVSRMPTGERSRDYNNRRDRIEPVAASNPVYAFENEMQSTQSWTTSGQATAPTSGDNGPLYKLLKTRELLPGLKSSDDSILDLPVAVISFASDRPPPEIAQVVGFGELAIRVVSLVTREANGLRISTSAVVSNPPSGEARFGFPVIRALQQTEPKSVGDFDEAGRFLGILSETIRTAEPNRGEWTVSSLIAAKDGTPLTVFRIRHPVTVSVGAERHCYLIATYSPIPVSLSLRSCW
jgi:hypothetical protein